MEKKKEKKEEQVEEKNITHDMEQTESLTPQEETEISKDSGTLQTRRESIDQLQRLSNAVQDFTTELHEYSRSKNGIAELQNVVQGLRTVVGTLTSDPDYRTDGKTEGDMSCPKCECVSENCCCYDVWLKAARMIAGQIELDQLADGETGIAGLSDGFEIKIFATVNGSGIIYPSLFGVMDIKKRKNRPGIWYPINRVINRVCISKGCARTFDIRFDVIERDAGRGGGNKELVAGKEEFGSGTARLTLDCGCSEIGPFHKEINLLGGGRGEGAIEIEFQATKVC